MAGALVFVTVLRMSQPPEESEEPAHIPAVVAARDIPLHTVIGPDDLEVRDVPPEMVPEGSYADPISIVGMLTTADIARGEIVLQRRLIEPDYVGPRAAFVMDPSRILVAIPTFDLLSSTGIIRPGDHIDILYTFDFEKAKPDIWTGMNTFTLLQDQVVAAVVYGEGAQPEGSASAPPSGGQGAPRAILLAVPPQDALLLKYFQDSGAAMDLALRSPAAQGQYEVVPIDGEYLLQRLNIRWQVKEEE